jgi:fucose permease
MDQNSETFKAISDHASTLGCMGFAAGSIIAPIIGGSLKDAYGFQASCDIMGTFAVCFSIIYALIAWM